MSFADHSAAYSERCQFHQNQDVLEEGNECAVFDTRAGH